MKKDIIIAGTGFRGFCDAIQLLNRGDCNIHMIESAPFFGGVLFSLDILGFSVDKGVHVFDSIPKELASIIEDIMDGQVNEIDFVSASAFNNKVTQGFSLPNLESLDIKIRKKIENELLILAEKQESYDDTDSLLDLFQKKYGDTAANVFSNIFKKVYGIESHEVEADAIAQTSLGRLKFLSDDKMRNLKKDPWLDQVLAARRKSMAPVDDFVSIYPNDGGAMKGWCLKAQDWLKKKGVKISLNTKINSITNKDKKVLISTGDKNFLCDKIIWSNDNVGELSNIMKINTDADDLHYGTPMLFITIVTDANKIKDFTYLQNFDPDGFTYRTAAAGIFSKQIRSDGTSFITSECPVEIDSDLWRNPETFFNKIWNEIKGLGIVSKNANIINYDIKKIPKTFKLAKIGYVESVKKFYSDLEETNNRILVRDVLPFFRRDIYFDKKHIEKI